ncbi:M28 family metallopeptidase [Pleionea mediterranea]|uniref:Zn-dependent M28 family amino/carboxypeptidase n=1 Tax=Pleionea mediterranea TaxID=523701 RepID=A0A316FGC3_9GAMM|nr:M28 family metallopeptidase [Pleionea mediterranea]PWK47864.1 Zn-dependent M28 family amino/carboxypeptidase [Pleionea mediterranea]
MIKYLALGLFAASASAGSNFEEVYNSINKQSFAEHVKTMSSDDFGGRAPDTEGEKKTINYMVKHFKALGLEPGNGDSFTQSVPLVSVESKPTQPLTIGDLSFDYQTDFVANSSQLKPQVSVKDSEVVFVGYGVVAPEFGWNDYAALDVKGKTVVILVNDPGYATGNPDLFTGKAMTYYGRWTYKYEEAARQGAAAAIIVHETAPASYGWNVVESSWTGPQFQLPKGKNSAPVVNVEMWITEPKARALMKKGGLDFDSLKQQAKQKGFKAQSLNLKANVAVENTIKRSQTNNIMATIPGTKRPDEHIIYMAHWDHLGTHPNKEGDNIYNGALDNATGTGALIMLAKAFKQLPDQPERSISFVAVGAEEQGLLGSKYYAENPVYPLEKTVGVINMDSLNVTGLMKDFTVVGFNKSELQEYLAKAAARQKRELVAETKPEAGSFYRSDHFSLAKQGVPAIYAGGGSEPLNAEQAKIAKQVGELKSRCYHQPCDEFSELWSLDSAVADIRVFFETGNLLANTKDWPNWYEGTEFKQARDESRNK